jgi:hypothetical protein
LGLIWLQLSQALAAVRSPCAPEKFHDQQCTRKKIVKRKYSSPICR